MLHLLSSGSPRNSTDPRDAISSLLGYLEALFPGTAPIRADYASSTCEVHTSLTVVLLTGLPYFTVLSLIDSRSRRHTKKLGLPSWAPNHTRRSVFGMVYKIVESSSSLRYSPTKMSFDYRAGGEQEEQNIAVDGNILQITARRLDVVAHVCPTAALDARDGRPRSEDVLRWHRRFAALVDVAEAGPRMSLSGHTMLEAALLVCYEPSPLLGDTVVEDQSSLLRAYILIALKRSCLMHMQSGEDTSMETTMSTTLQLMHRLQPTEPCMPSKEDLFWIESLLAKRNMTATDLKKFDSLTTLVANYEHVLIASRFSVFTLDNGYVGSAMVLVQPSDELWLLHNARMPHLLRPMEDGSFSLLGDALVDGVMFGEAIRDGIAEPPREICII